MKQGNFTYDFFIGYASPDVKKAEELYNILLKSDFKVFLACKGLAPSDPWDTKIPEVQKSAQINVFLISQNTRNAHYEREEIAIAIQLIRTPGSGIRVVPVYLEERINAYGLGILQGIVATDVGEMRDVANKLRDLKTELAQPHPKSHLGLMGPGVGPRDPVFDMTKALPDHRVFASELLTQPIIIERKDGQTHVWINRTGVDSAVYTTAGKNWLCREFLNGEVEKWAKKKDKEIHAFLIKAKPGCMKFSLPLHNFPLRWASGGVLSVVTVPGREGQWTPFFFRDIAPIGWNISLGSTENSEELDDPWKFLLREFLEETLVHTNHPSNTESLRSVKTFEVGPAPDGFRVPRQRAEEFSQRHRKLRYAMDAVDYKPALDDDYTISCEVKRTKTDIRIRNHDEESAHTWKDVIVCFNLMELGIEVVKILEYDLGADDEILDGEILERRDKNTDKEWQELVRMPVALISHNYLKKVFGKSTSSFEPDYPELYESTDGVINSSPEQVKQPCVKPNAPLEPDDIIIFHRDAVRRKEICDLLLKKKLLDVHPSDRKALARHVQWQKNFGHFFLNSKGKPISNNPAPWFTFASAKVMSYYFANKTRS